MFSRTDLSTDSERFYISIVELLDDSDEKDEVQGLLHWWNRYVLVFFFYIEFIDHSGPGRIRQIFPTSIESTCLPSENSALATIRRKRAAIKAGAATAGASTSTVHAD